jgi:hypothetical protein
MLSTTVPPLPLDIVIVYSEDEFCGYVYSWRNPFSVEYRPLDSRTKTAQNHRERFKVLSEMHRVREFQLVLCADVLDCIAEYAVQVLERTVGVERKYGDLRYLLSKPLVISEIRSPRSRPVDDRVDRKGRHPPHLCQCAVIYVTGWGKR